MEIRFKLNPKNEKDQVIINVLSGEYSPSETIKNILYKMGTNGADGQRVLFWGLCDDVKGSVAGDINPMNDDEWNRMDESSGDNRCQEEWDEDIASFFSTR